MKQMIILFDIDYTLFRTDLFKKSNLQKHANFREVNSVLRELSQKASLGILSEGLSDFQRNKLFMTSIDKYFQKDYVHINEKKETVLEEILNKYKKNSLFLVDDKLSILYLAKKISPSVFTVWIKRGPYASSQNPIPDFTPDAIIENLKELITIISKH